jgi:hypothetical protein
VATDDDPSGIGTPPQSLDFGVIIEEMLGKSTAIIIAGTEKKNGFHREPFRCYCSSVSILPLFNSKRADLARGWLPMSPWSFARRAKSLSR